MTKATTGRSLSQSPVWWSGSCARSDTRAWSEKTPLRDFGCGSKRSAWRSVIP